MESNNIKELLEHALHLTDDKNNGKKTMECFDNNCKYD